jgi:3-hydroxybutyryl-CoA dehydrogenase
MTTQEMSPGGVKIERVVVIGAGTMGAGIAHVFAIHGFAVSLSDPVPEALERALASIAANMDRQVKKEILAPGERTDALARIRPVARWEDEVEEAELVVEAVPERTDLKERLFQELDDRSSADAILASNTSSISITALGAQTSRPERVIGMHFMNPVPVMELVEVVRGLDTGDETVRAVIELARSLGKTPVQVNDFPGFVSNRILMPMINEAIFVLTEGVAEAEAIDTVMQLGMRHPLGPLALADLDRVGHLPQRPRGPAPGVGRRSVPSGPAPPEVCGRRPAGPEIRSGIPCL